MMSEQVRKQILGVQAAYKNFWQSIEPPYACEFTGTYKDVEALDYLHYEGIEFPGDSLFDVSLVWGDALRHHLGLNWYAHDDQRLFYPVPKDQRWMPFFYHSSLPHSQPSDGIRKSSIWKTQLCL